MEERGVNVDHATLNRRVVRYSPLIAREAHRRKSAMIGKKSTSSVDWRCCGVWAKKSYKTVYT